MQVNKIYDESVYDINMKMITIIFTVTHDSK